MAGSGTRPFFRTVPLRVHKVSVYRRFLMTTEKHHHHLPTAKWHTTKKMKKLPLSKTSYFHL